MIGGHGYRAEISADHGCIVDTGPDGERRLPLTHVIGGKNVFYFLTPGERGRLQTAPLAFDIRERVWFDVADSVVRHVPGQVDDKPLPWTDHKYTFNALCYNCHASQVSTNYDLESDTYHTTWAEPGVNCEICHGPAGEHVRICREAKQTNKEPPADLRLISMKRMPKSELDASCAACHARMTPITTTFKPGERFDDHFELTVVDNPDFYPDGRDLGENYTYASWRMNPCAQSGQLGCMHCHTSSGRYRFTEANANNACLPCHAERVAHAADHSHHPADSDGSKCVSCHMPTTKFGRMQRSDHSLRPPMPALTREFKSPNACNLCHTDHDATWADQLVRTWHSDDYQSPVQHVARLIAAARNHDWSQLATMLEYVTAETHDAVMAAGLIRLLADCADTRLIPPMIEALRDESPLVRAAAAHTLRGRLAPDAVTALLTALGDESRLVRIRSAEALAPLPQVQLPQAQRSKLAAATNELAASFAVRDDDHMLYYNRGNFLADCGKPTEALAAYRVASRLEPTAVAPHVNAALVLHALERVTEAEDELRQALRIDPRDFAANLNLGLLLAEAGRLPEAEATLRTACAADPNSAVAAYNLGVLMVETQPDEALEWCQRAAALRTDDPRYAYTLAFYQQRMGRTDDARATLQDIISRHPSCAEAHALLGQSYEDAHDTPYAIQVYERAANEPSLAAPERAYFQAQVDTLRARGN
ncbi:MAG: ammonia-forming cytochrome c nitrite reductase subunit c552 [Phycisphaerales bacterium]|nr:ammonia-forming cytochrome c nitrite reductase subunit c552 [Phycisphaerales bacterium]